MITETLPSERFPSLSALQAEHSALQTALGKQVVKGPQAHTIAQLVERAVETGAILDNREDRQSAQAIINYWMSRAAPSVRLESSTPNPFADPEFDSLLRDFDPRTIVGATAAADRWLESLTDEQRLTARRILLRLVRLPSDKSNFEAIPTSRTSLHDVHVDSALVDQMIAGLAQSGVVRVTPGSSTEVDQVALRSADLVTSWATYSRWLKERLDFRQRAESWSQAQRLGHTSPELERGLLQGNDLEEVRSYHDRNPQERKYIETCWLRERFKSESNRRWKWIFGILLAVSFCCLLFANNRWREAIAQREAAKDALKKLELSVKSEQAAKDDALLAAAAAKMAASAAEQAKDEAAVARDEAEQALKQAIESQQREQEAKKESIEVLESLIDEKQRMLIGQNSEFLKKYTQRLEVLKNEPGSQEIMPVRDPMLPQTPETTPPDRVPEAGPVIDKGLRHPISPKNVVPSGRPNSEVELEQPRIQPKLGRKIPTEDDPIRKSPE